MDKEVIASAVAVERQAMADLVESLTTEQLATPSLCAGWTVHHVAAHLCTMWDVSLPGLLWRMARARGSMTTAIDHGAHQAVLLPVERIVASLRSHARNIHHPSRSPVAPLADIVVHGDDIRRPLGLPRAVPADSVRASLDFITAGRLRPAFLPRHRLHGLRLVATDLDWSWGHGAEVRGPAQPLLLAAMGRRIALAELEGATPVLDARL